MASSSTPGPHARDAPMRKLAVYRALVVLLAGFLLAMLVRTRKPDAPKGIEVIDVAAQVADARRTRRNFADTVNWFYVSETGTAHLHVLTVHQTCPLHIHRNSYEATLILSGGAEVTHVFGDGGELMQTTTHLGPGSVVATPPLCGHAWKNAEPDDMQANLVFESPRFDGNLYVASTDPIMKPGARPSLHDLPRELAAFVTSGETLREVDLPLPGRVLTEVFVRGETSLPVVSGRTLLVYVVAGGGTLEDESDPSSHVPLRAQSIAIAHDGRPVTVRTSEPTALLVFRP